MCPSSSAVHCQPDLHENRKKHKYRLSNQTLQPQQAWTPAAANPAPHPRGPHPNPPAPQL